MKHSLKRLNPRLNVSTKILRGWICLRNSLTTVGCMQGFLLLLSNLKCFCISSSRTWEWRLKGFMTFLVHLRLVIKFSVSDTGPVPSGMSLVRAPAQPTLLLAPFTRIGNNIAVFIFLMSCPMLKKIFRHYTVKFSNTQCTFKMRIFLKGNLKK